MLVYVGIRFHEVCIPYLLWMLKLAVGLGTYIGSITYMEVQLFGRFKFTPPPRFHSVLFCKNRYLHVTTCTYVNTLYHFQVTWTGGVSVSRDMKHTRV